MPKDFAPDWAKDAVFYQIFPDRFAFSPDPHKPSNLEPWDAPPTNHGFKGGDLLGVAQRLDYLADLGITAIYLNPVFQSAANHRYHTHDYFEVDPLLGGNRALRTLLDAAHRKGIRVILDGVFNHASRGFYQFHHILENGPTSPYVDWFIIHGYPLHAYEEQHRPNYDCWWGLRGLPKFNVHTPAVREFLWSVAEHWIRFGVDGWRLDVPEEINDPPFWQEFRRRVKAVNPDAYLLGEIWHPALDWLQGDRFDGVMNYPFTRACIGALVDRDIDQGLLLGPHPVGRMAVPDFGMAIHHLMEAYPPELAQSLFNPLDSHDTPRFLTFARGDVTALRLAVLFQMTYPGAPSIYYGDEIGMSGGRDPDCRRAFPWDEGKWDRRLRAYVKQCIALRKAHPALRRGSYTALRASAEIYAFARSFEREVLVVALNIASSPHTTTVPLAGLLPDGSRMRQAWSPDTNMVISGALRDVTLPPRSGNVWIANR